jgi:hypothetical protein
VDHYEVELEEGRGEGSQSGLFLQERLLEGLADVYLFQSGLE